MGKSATVQQQNDFINKIAPIIQKCAIERGYHNCSGTIAQAICESNFGLSELSAKYYNYFGLKCGSSWKGKSVNMKTQEYYDSYVTIKDNFRCYNDMTDGVNGYYDFISTKRYEGLKECYSADTFLNEIKKSGYATSPTYVKTTLDIVKKYNLEKYDSVFGNKKTDSIDVNELPVLKLYSNDLALGKNYVASWQEFLKGLGLYDGAIDGIFGTKTHFAVKGYQSMWNTTHDNKLVVDGIVGKDTWNTLNLK